MLHRSGPQQQRRILLIDTRTSTTRHTTSTNTNNNDCFATRNAPFFSTSVFETFRCSLQNLPHTCNSHLGNTHITRPRSCCSLPVSCRIAFFAKETQSNNTIRSPSRSSRRSQEGLVVDVDAVDEVDFRRFPTQQSTSEGRSKLLTAGQSNRESYDIETMYCERKRQSQRRFDDYDLRS